ncbi:hypothetical protein SAMN05428949_0015 [Chitinophaga sp. YR627]|uniref:hypothetical protein n=1 Tax=Chitinophaga sp. YR627 TaxID=1881041 RepID=UPI0008E0A08A|nr:hypothetical protein [Chitinophaga sp. YR627]SFM57123.1 hypothetical protein SAMN05428949_0015 [Chitinophaga sp. YR627]
MKAIFLGTIVLFLLSCQRETSNNQERDVIDSVPTLQRSELAALIEGFSIPFNEDLRDTNTVFFFCLPSFDTSYVLHLRKRRDGVQGIIYKTMPQYRNAIMGFAGKSDEVLPFSGFGFRMDIAGWDRFIEHASRVAINSRKDGKNSGCCDGTSYLLLYKSQPFPGGNLGDTAFENFTQYIKDSVLNKYVASRIDRPW